MALSVSVETLASPYIFLFCCAQDVFLGVTLWVLVQICLQKCIHLLRLLCPNWKCVNKALISTSQYQKRNDISSIWASVLEVNKVRRVSQLCSSTQLQLCQAAKGVSSGPLEKKSAIYLFLFIRLFFLVFFKTSHHRRIIMFNGQCYGEWRNVRWHFSESRQVQRT